MYMSKQKPRQKKFELYITTNTANGKIYGGKHSYSSITRGDYIGSGFRLKRAVAKYGREAFTTRVLRLNIKDMDDLNKREIRLIRLLKHMFGDRCYNIHRGGGGGDYYMYLTPEERIAVNRNISEGKRKQYARGQTTKQLDGRKRQRETLMNRHRTDPEFAAYMLEAQRKKGKSFSERIRTVGHTEAELIGHQNHRDNGNYQLTYDIIYPDGAVVTETMSSKKFKQKYHTDDMVFSNLNKHRTTVIKKRLAYITKHPFPAGTRFVVKES